MARLQEEKNYMDFGSQNVQLGPEAGGGSGSAGNLIASGTSQEASIGLCGEIQAIAWHMLRV